jgi:hypothetical protein
LTDHPMFRLFTDEQVRKNDIDTLERWLRPKLGGYIVAIKDLGSDNEFFRGVVWPEPPNSVADLSYPPVSYAKLNRASRDGQPMFYASRGAPPVFFELRAKAGQRIALSQWAVNEPIWMHNLGYHQDALRRLGGPNTPLRHHFLNSIPGESKENLQLRRLLSLAFTADVSRGREYRYRLSVAIHELLFGKAEPIPLRPGGPKSGLVAGTAYPAQQMKGVADNVAIWPAFVDSSLTIKSARYVLVEKAEDGLSYALFNLAIADTFYNGQIDWHDTDGPDVSRRTYLTFEDGLWISRDGYGRIYDRH